MTSQKAEKQGSEKRGGRAASFFFCQGVDATISQVVDGVYGIAVPTTGTGGLTMMARFLGLPSRRSPECLSMGVLSMKIEP